MHICTHREREGSAGPKGSPPPSSLPALRPNAVVKAAEGPRSTLDTRFDQEHLHEHCRQRISGGGDGMVCTQKDRGLRTSDSRILLFHTTIALKCRSTTAQAAHHAKASAPPHTLPTHRRKKLSLDALVGPPLVPCMFASSFFRACKANVGGWGIWGDREVLSFCPPCTTVDRCLACGVGGAAPAHQPPPPPCWSAYKGHNDHAKDGIQYESSPRKWLTDEWIGALRSVTCG